MDYPKTLHRKNPTFECGYESVSVADESEHEEMKALGFGESLLEMGIETHPSQETLLKRRIETPPASPKSRK